VDQNNLRCLQDRTLKQGLAVLNLFHRLLVHVLVRRSYLLLVKHRLLHCLISLLVDLLFLYLMQMCQHRYCKPVVLIYNDRLHRPSLHHLLLLMLLVEMFHLMCLRLLKRLKCVVCRAVVRLLFVLWFAKHG
jgi:hypothetical protein